MHFIKKSFVGIIVLAALVLPSLLMVPVSAQVSEEAKDAACEGLGAVGDSCDEANGGSSISSLIASAIGILSFIVGVAAVIVLIIGGLKYITSAGDSNSVASAKSTVLYAVIGLVIAILAQGIVQFVLNRVTT